MTRVALASEMNFIVDGYFTLREDNIQPCMIKENKSLLQKIFAIYQSISTPHSKQLLS